MQVHKHNKTQPFVQKSQFSTASTNCFSMVLDTVPPLHFPPFQCYKYTYLHQVQKSQDEPRINGIY